MHNSRSQEGENFWKCQALQTYGGDPPNPQFPWWNHSLLHLSLWQIGYRTKSVYKIGKNILVAHWTTNGRNLVGPVSIEWPVDVMCCAHLIIFAFIDVIYPSLANVLGLPVSQWTNQMNLILKVDQSIYRSPCATGQLAILHTAKCCLSDNHLKTTPASSTGVNTPSIMCTS